MPWPIETPPAHSTGLESKTVSGGQDSFSLDFSFYRTGHSGDHRLCFESLEQAQAYLARWETMDGCVEVEAAYYVYRQAGLDVG